MVIFIAHGSRDPKWRASIEAVVAALQADLGDARVRLAYMEHATPSLMDVAETAVREGAKSIHVAPLFLAEHGHVTRHIAPMVDRLRQLHTGVDVTLLPTLAAYQGFRDLLREIAAQALH